MVTTDSTRRAEAQRAGTVPMPCPKCGRPTFRGVVNVRTWRGDRTGAERYYPNGEHTPEDCKMWAEHRDAEDAKMLIRFRDERRAAASLRFLWRVQGVAMDDPNRAVRLSAALDRITASIV